MGVTSAEHIAEDIRNAILDAQIKAFGLLKPPPPPKMVAVHPSKAEAVREKLKDADVTLRVSEAVEPDRVLIMDAPRRENTMRFVL